MTECQELMLAVCFGGMVGVIVTEIGFLIAEMVRCIRTKHRKRKEEKAARQQNK